MGEADDLPKEGVRNHSDKQLKHLLSFFEVCQTPSLEDREILASKLNLPGKKVLYWFSNEKRKGKKGDQREASQGVSEMEVDDDNRPKRDRKKPLPPDQLLAPNMRHLLKTESIVEYDNSEILDTDQSIDTILLEGIEAVCVGVDLNPNRQRCLLCTFTSSTRGILFKHIRSHGYEPKFCSVNRKESELESKVKGCRKVFTIDSFNLHICTRAHPFSFDLPLTEKAPT